MILDKLQDFNKVTKYYKEILNFMGNLKPNSLMSDIGRTIRNYMENVSEYSRGDLPYDRILVNNISMFIAQIHEKTKDVDDSILANAFENIDSVKNIQCKKEIPLIEKKRQIRNCLAHASYHFVIEDVNVLNKKERIVEFNTYIEIENEYIKGRIPLDEVKAIAKNFLNIYSKNKYGDDVRFFAPEVKKIGEIGRVNLYHKDIHQFVVHRRLDKEGLTFEQFKNCFYRKYNIQDNQKEDFENFFKNIKENFETFDLEDEEFTEDEMNFWRNYINFVGFKGFEPKHMLEHNEQNAIDNSILNIMSVVNKEKIIPLNLLTESIETLKYFEQCAYLDLKDDNNIEMFCKKFIFFSYQSPIIYANNLLGMAYYELNFVRETNKQNNKEYFNYNNLKNLDNINAVITDKKGTIIREIPVQKDLMEKSQNELEHTEGVLSKLKKDIYSKRKNLDSLNNPLNKNPNKEEVIRKINKEIEYLDINIKKYELRKKELTEIIDIYKGKTVKDSSDFFRHLRNSLAHGKYTIEYGDLNNVNEIKYIFHDETDEGDYIYTVELTARQLMEILDGFEQKINECDTGYLQGKEIEDDILEAALRELECGEEELQQELWEFEHGDESNGIDSLGDNKSSEEIGDDKKDEFRA